MKYLTRITKQKEFKIQLNAKEKKVYIGVLFVILLVGMTKVLFYTNFVDKTLYPVEATK